MASRPKRKTIPKVVRNEVWNKHFVELNGKCHCCKKVISVFDFEAGHIVSVAEGGSDDVSNFHPLCSTCNKSMGAQNMDDFISSYFSSKKEDQSEVIKLKEKIAENGEKELQKNLEKLEDEFEEKKEKLIEDSMNKVQKEQQLAEKNWREKNSAKVAKVEPKGKYVEKALKIKSNRLKTICDNIAEERSPIRVRVVPSENRCQDSVFHLTSAQIQQLGDLKAECTIILDSEQVKYIKDLNFTSNGYISKLHSILNAEDSDDPDELEVKLPGTKSPETKFQGPLAPETKFQGPLAPETKFQGPLAPEVQGASLKVPKNVVSKPTTIPDFFSAYAALCQIKDYKDFVAFVSNSGGSQKEASIRSFWKGKFPDGTVN